MESRNQKREGAQRRPFVESMKNFFTKGKVERDAAMAEKYREKQHEKAEEGEFAEKQHEEAVEKTVESVNASIIEGLTEDVDDSELL